MLASFKRRPQPPATLRWQRVAPVAVRLDERRRYAFTDSTSACAAVSPQARQPGRLGILAKYLSSVSSDGSRRADGSLYRPMS